jgi:predicted dehydrogenase
MTSPDRREFLQQVAGSLAAVALTPDFLPLPPLLRGAPLPVALVGCGKQGKAILTELLKFDAAKITAVCDLREERQKAALRRAAGAAAFTDHAKLLAEAKDVAAVFVATPSHLHRQVVLDCLAAGKHVYCEAPLAASLDDLKAIAAAARASKGVLQVGHVLRSNPVYQLARSFMKSGSIRDLTHLRAQHRQRTDWKAPSPDAESNWRLQRKNGCGLPLEVGSHQLDTVSWFVGKFPTSVRASGAVLGWSDGRDVPDTVSATLAFPDQVVMQWEATLTNSYEGVHELFVGTMGAIKMAQTFGWLFKEADAPTQGWEVYASREKFHDEEGITLIADATKLAAQGKLKEGIGLPNPPLYYALEDFLKSAIEGKPVVCGAAEGFRAAAMAIQLQQALDSGGEVAIPPQLLKGE